MGSENHACHRLTLWSAGQCRGIDSAAAVRSELGAAPGGFPYGISTDPFRHMPSCAFHPHLSTPITYLYV